MTTLETMMADKIKTASNELETMDKIEKHIPFELLGMTRADLAFRLDSLKRVHGQRAIDGLLGFIKYTKSVRILRQNIATELAHDIFGKHDDPNWRPRLIRFADTISKQ